jgi:hypothetical protein
MINYIEKGYGLHEEIERQGHTLAQIDGVWVSSDDKAVQSIIDNYREILPPNWDNFNITMMSDGRFNQVYNQCLKISPIVANSLPTAISQVTTHGTSLFALVFNNCCAIGGATPQDRFSWANMAVENHLPDDFIAILKG